MPTTKKPRKPHTRRPGSAPIGRPPTGRTINLPRVRPDVHARAAEWAAVHQVSLADAVEAAIGRL